MLKSITYYLLTPKRQPALIIVHRKQLFDHWIERIQAFLNIPKHERGQVATGKKKVGKQITVAMIQSLKKDCKSREINSVFGNIIARINPEDLKHRSKQITLTLKKTNETIVVSGEDSERSRKSKLEQIEMGHFQVVLSTGQFFGEGLDVPNFNGLFLVYPFAFEGKLIQYNRASPTIRTFSNHH